LPASLHDKPRLVQDAELDTRIRVSVKQLSPLTNFRPIIATTLTKVVATTKAALNDMIKLRRVAVITEITSVVMIIGRRNESTDGSRASTDIIAGMSSGTITPHPKQR